MRSSALKNRIIEECKSKGLNMVGFTPTTRWEHPPKNLPNHFSDWIPSEFWPQHIYPETKTVLVIGLPVPLPIIETAPSIFYHELYLTINTLLDIKAYELANFITELGYPSINLARDGYGDVEVLLKKPLSFFSHKHAAYLAGLGSFGLNNVLLTPEYGPRVRFTSLFLDAKLKGDNILEDDLCLHCHLCADKCPVQAIDYEDPSKDFPPPMDKIKCALRSKDLREKFKNPCGICIKVCPVGEDREVFQRKNINIYRNRDDFNEYYRAWEHVQSYGSPD